MCKVIDGKVISDGLTTGNKFSDGNSVIIRLGYNGDFKEEFRGFVKSKSLGMPLEIACEGFSWLLRRNKISRFWKSISLKDLLREAITGIDRSYSIQIECPVDFHLTNVYINNGNGCSLIDKIQQYTDECLSCFFISPDTLYCGTIYNSLVTGMNTLSSHQVAYRLGYNLPKENTLRQRSAEMDKVNVSYSRQLSDGSFISRSSDVFDNPTRTYSKVLNHIEDPDVLKLLAKEKAYRLNYNGYEGEVKAFLQPFADVGYSAHIVDDRYPERNGKYLVESVETHFGVNGARRNVELGALTSSLKK